MNLALFSITWPQFVEAVPIILALIIIEGLLSVDNALAIAALAAHLPAKQRTSAMRLGIAGAYPFRILALYFANIIIQNSWLKIAGAAYLIHLLLAHFAGKISEEDRDPNVGADGSELPGEGHAAAHGHQHHCGEAKRGFWSTVFAIQFLNLSLSVDNVVAAVAMSPLFWVVCTGVVIGILALMFLASLCVRLIEKYPVLEDAAFLLIGYVGALLLFEMGTHYDLGTLGKFIGILLILGASLYYERSAGFKRALAPVWTLLHAPLRFYATVLDALFAPFRALFARRKSAELPAAPANPDSSFHQT